MLLCELLFHLLVRLSFRRLRCLFRQTAEFVPQNAHRHDHHPVRGEPAREGAVEVRRLEQLFDEDDDWDERGSGGHESPHHLHSSQSVMSGCVEGEIDVHNCAPLSLSLLLLLVGVSVGGGGCVARRDGSSGGGGGGGGRGRRGGGGGVGGGGGGVCFCSRLGRGLGRVCAGAALSWPGRIYGGVPCICDGSRLVSCCVFLRATLCLSALVQLVRRV
mmetsp:Transcript_9233/g.23407  ORF Transcript_9233/g.23407 Transcript_9233/m.23407 type:complete len:217 (-) Transcript_9233:119-769(-)